MKGVGSVSILHSGVSNLQFGDEEPYGYNWTEEPMAKVCDLQMYEVQGNKKEKVCCLFRKQMYRIYEMDANVCPL